MSTWLTAAELSKRLDRPLSTIRSWRDRYRPFVEVRSDRHGRQTFEVGRMTEIAALAAQRLTPREIAAELERRQERGAGGSPPREVTLADLHDKLDAIHAVLERIADHLGAGGRREESDQET